MKIVLPGRGLEALGKAAQQKEAWMVQMNRTNAGEVKLKLTVECLQERIIPQ